MNVKTGTKLGPYSRTANNLILYSPTVFFTARSVVQRGIAMISCLSVCPSVTLVDCDHCDHRRWKSAKIISRVISDLAQGPGSRRTPTSRIYSKGKPLNFSPNRSGVGKKWHAGEQKRQSLKRVKIEEKLYDIQKLTNALSNGTIPDPLRPPLPQNWGSQPQPKTAI